MSGWLEHLVFGILATVSVLSSFLVVTRKNPIYSALFLVVMFADLRRGHPNADVYEPRTWSGCAHTE